MRDKYGIDWEPMHIEQRPDVKVIILGEVGRICPDVTGCGDVSPTTVAASLSQHLRKTIRESRSPAETDLVILIGGNSTYWRFVKEPFAILR